MGVAKIGRYCLEGDQQQQKKGHIHILANDYQYFEKERWYTFHNPILFDTNKFIFLYPHYEQQQTQLLHKWNSVVDIKAIEYGQYKNDQEVLSSRWKYAIRRGVPVQYYKVIIGAIFNKNLNSSSQNYQKIKHQVNFNEPAPLFGHEQVSLNQAVFAPFLNDKGWLALKDLMHMFKKRKGETFYNKYIGHFTAIFLIFFSESQTYELMSAMIEDSTNMTLNRLDSLRWHLVFKQEQMKNNLAASFYRIVGTNSPTLLSIIKYLDRNSIDKIKLFYNLTQNFFYSYLPFPFILRIFIIFINEGVKVMFRICYVILAYCEKEIKNATSLKKVCLVIKKKCLCLSNVQILCMLKKSFNLNLKAVISPRLIESRLKKQQCQKKYYYLPNIEGVSNILSYQDLQFLWNFLPFQLKSYDLKIKYPLQTTNPQKLKLKDLLKSLEDQPFCLIIIKTITNNENHVFGCFIADKVSSQQSQEWYGSNQNFVFTLHPQQKKYTCTRQNNHYLKTTKKCFSVGFGENGSALVLHDDLQKGQTYKCGTFSSEALNGKTEGQFQIDWIEAFILF